jgi:hypothetical protein
MTGIFQEWRPVYAECGIATSPGREVERANVPPIRICSVSSVVPLTNPTNSARHPAQWFEPQQNPRPMLTAVRGGAHDEQFQETIRQNASAARDRADHQDHWKNSWRPASWVPAEEQHRSTESKVEILKD